MYITEEIGLFEIFLNSSNTISPKFNSEENKPSKSSQTKFKSEEKPSSPLKPNLRVKRNQSLKAAKKNPKQPSCQGQGSCIEQADLASTGINVKKSDLKGDEIDIAEIDVGKIDVGKMDIDDTEVDDIIDIDDIDDIDIDIDYYYDDDDDKNTDDQTEDTVVNEVPSTTDVYTSLINESAITAELEMIKQGKFKLQSISSGSVINPINDSAFALQGLEIGNSTVNWINDDTPDQVLALVGVNNSKTVKIPNGYNTYLAQDEVVLGKNDLLVLTFVPELQKWLQVGFEENTS